jgi:hypothetical protein
MRHVLGLLVLLVTTSARADTPCELAVDLHGGIAEGTVRRQLEPTETTSVVDVDLPTGGKLVGVELRGRDGAGAAVSVSTAFTTQRVTDATVVGADPALAMERVNGHVRVVLQPIAAGRQVTLVAHWTAVADIEDGELRLVLPPRGARECHGTLHAAAGPGATISHVRVDAAQTRGATASFVVGDQPITLAAELAFARPEPIAWLQEQPLGDGTVARALTVAAPRSPSLAQTRRALLVIDNSRSMNLVGRDSVAKLVAAVGAALPSGSEIEAIAFDRAPARLLGAWRPTDGAALAAIDAALAKRAPRNGSDLGTALALAHEVLTEGKRSPALVIVITDGVLGDLDADSLATKLGDPRDVDLHAIVIDPSEMKNPTADALAGAIARVGGGYAELSVADLPGAFGHVPGWLSPAWQLAVTGGAAEIPAQLRAGEGFVAIEIAKTQKPLALTATAELTKLALAPRGGSTTSLVAQLALARATEVPARVFAQHPFADATHDLAVLANAGKVAANRRAMIAGGGPYTRMTAVEDPDDAFEAAGALTQVVPPPPTVIDHDILQHLFELQLQPAAYRCFQRALGRTPELAGTVQFGIELGRGEVTRVVLAGTGDAVFDGCLVDAAYSLVPPLLDPKIDPDDRTIANYPLTFSVRADKPIVVAGDADSASPIDIDAVKGGVPRLPRRGPVRAQDTTTPLGPLRPTK